MALSSPEIEQLIGNLDQKERYYLASRLLPTLSKTQLENLIEKSEDLLTDLVSERETSVLFDIRKISGSYYAYIRRIGKEYPNLYLGLIRFQKGKTYKLTHKTTGSEQVVRGLGLEQRGLKTYLKIEFLSPEQVVRDYLFYDASLEIPRLPQKIDVEKLNESLANSGGQVVFSTVEHGLSNANKYKNTVTPRKDWSAIFMKKDWLVEEINDSSDKSKLDQPSLDKLKSAIAERSPISLEKQSFQPPIPKEIPSKKLLQQVQPIVTKQTIIQVGKSFSYQVEKYLHQWANLSQLLPDNLSLQLSVEPEKMILRDRSRKQLIVEYDRSSRRLNVPSPRLLHSLLLEIVSNVATNKLVQPDQQSSARKWLLNLQSPPLQDSKMLLAFIFDL